MLVEECSLAQASKKHAGPSNHLRIEYFVACLWENAREQKPSRSRLAPPITSSPANPLGAQCFSGEANTLVVLRTAKAKIRTSANNEMEILHIETSKNHTSHILAHHRRLIILYTKWWWRVKVRSENELIGLPVCANSNCPILWLWDMPTATAPFYDYEMYNHVPVKHALGYNVWEFEKELGFLQDDSLAADVLDAVVNSQPVGWVRRPHQHPMKDLYLQEHTITWIMTLTTISMEGILSYPYYIRIVWYLLCFVFI